MRIVAGRAKGRRLVAPKGGVTRPTSDFVREAIFNTLQSIVEWEDVEVVDLFAGSGALGIEALSRGAASCTFVDSDRRAVEVIRANLSSTGMVGGVVVQSDVPSWVARDHGHAEVVFADPPYAFDQWDVIGLVDADIVVAESDREVALGDRWAILRSRRYGSTVVTLFEPRSEL